MENGQVQRLLTGKDTTGSERLHSHWSKSLVYKQIDQLLSGSEVVSPSHNETEEGIDEGESTFTDAFNTEGGADINSTGTNLTAFPIVDSSSGFSPIRIGRSPQSLASPSISKQPLVLPLDFWKMLDVYYAFTHAWLPISEKHDVLKTAYSYPSEGVYLQASGPGSGSHAELWAVLALTAHQINPRKDQADIDRYMANTRDLIPSESGPFDIGHLRAILLLTLIYVGRCECTSAWVMVGFAVRIAYDIGLHRKSNIRYPRQKHVLLACFIIETIVAKQRSLPAHLKAEDVMASGYLEEDGLEEWNPWDGGASDASQGQFAPPRHPAQTLSMFNDLVRTLQGQPDDLEDQLNDQRPTSTRPTPTRNTSSVGQQATNVSARNRQGRSDSSNRRVLREQQSLPENPTWTPQRLHSRIVKVWIETGSQTENSNPQVTVVQWLEQYVRSFGTATVPPTLVPILGSLSDVLDPSGNNVMLRNLINSISATWTRSPLSISHPQNSLGIAAQHLSPVSVTYDVPRPVLGRNHTNSTVEGIVLPAAVQQFHSTRDNRMSNDAAFFQTPVPLGMQSSSSLPHIGIPTMLDASSPNPPLQLQQHPAVQPSGSNFYSIPSDEGHAADLDAIFEEIAMLDGARPDDDRPQFMRNLGLGPDLDLSAFFGTDYQPSDPLFSYLQSDTYGQPGTDENNMYPGT